MPGRGLNLKSLFSRKSQGLLDAKKYGDLELNRHFKVLRVLGSGAFATVYEVQRKADGQRYALKHIDIQALQPPERADLVNELRLLSSLHHPALMAYYEAFVEGDQLCIVTEFMSQGELARLLRKRADADDPLPERLVWSYFLQILLGLRYMHHNHVLHADLKPENVLLGEDGVLKIGDLGISQRLDRIFACKPGGTPNYVSPEMWRRQPYSYSADVWALGCMLHELCTLRPLFAAATIEGVRDKVLSGAVPPIPSRYSHELAGLVRQMLDPDLMRRPTIAEILEMPAVRARIPLLPPWVLPCGCFEDEKLCADIAEPIKIPRQLWEWQCVNLCLPPSRYPTGGPGVIEALWERPLEACRIYFDGSPPARRQEGGEAELGLAWGLGRPPLPADTGAGGGRGGAAAGEGGTLQLGGCRSLRRRRAPSAPDLRQLAMRERRNSVCVAEVLLHRPSAATGWWGDNAGGGGGDADSAAAEREASGAAPGGPAAGIAAEGASAGPAELAERSLSDFQAQLLAEGAGARSGGRGKAGSRLQRQLGPFDPSPVEFCPMPRR